MPNNYNIKYFTREHRGSLYESMQTMKYITKKRFNELLTTGLYEYYAYDTRVFQYLFILKDIEKYYKKYTVYIGLEVIEAIQLFDPEDKNI